MTARDLTPADRREVFVPALNGSVRVRPIPPSRDRRFRRRAMKCGKWDGAAYNRLRFQFALVDPSFTAAEVERIFLTHGASVELVLARIDEISRTRRVVVDERMPRLQRRAVQMAAVATRALRERGDHARVPRRLDRRLGCGRPATRRVSNRTSSARGDPDLAGEPPRAPLPEGAAA
jgi:hypothetical protein